MDIVRLKGSRWTARSGSPPVWMTPLLAPAALLYRSATALARRTRGRKGSPGNGPFVVSVGNIEVGGTGKTPLALHLSDFLAARGDEPVYVSRGYGSRAERFPAVTVVPPRGRFQPLPDGVEARIVRRDSPNLCAEIGDEAAMVGRLLPDLALLLSRDKRRCLELAGSLFGATHAVVDDGFQSWDMPRDLDVVLLSGLDVLERSRVLPMGRLREGLSGLGRADIIGLVTAEPVEPGHAAERIERVVGIAKPVFCALRRLSLERPDGGEAERPDGPVAALSAVCNPAGFERMLLELGLDLRISIRYPDHHDYGPEDIPRIEALLTERAVERVVVTAKDWVKLAELDHRLPILVAREHLEIAGADLYGAMKRPQP